MANEKITDIFIASLLKESGIKYIPNDGINKEVKEALKTASKNKAGKQGFPEFTAQSEEFILVIEDKSDLNKHTSFENEEKTILSNDPKSVKNFAMNGAVHYAQKIVDQTNFKKVFAFGCSGDEKHHKITPIFITENEIKILPEVENFENFTQENIKNYYNEQIRGERPEEEKEIITLCEKSKDLHESLRNYGQLGETEKPLVVSAILLALNDKDNENLLDNLKGQETKTDGEWIFDALRISLKNSEVPVEKTEVILNQFTIIKDRSILNQKDSRLGKTPLKYFTEFIKNNISDKINSYQSPADVLGKFYGEFMKYSGGDGQTLGVVLTPHHITELFCDLIELNQDDVIFDPCCGTGGFLLAGMHKMIENADNDKEKIHNIKKNQIFGIEVREDMFSIATTNMILRGDGKSNLRREDFLKIDPKELQKDKYTVGLMNPPYSQRKNKETAHLSEINFISHLLDSLNKNARCAVIIPQSTMVGKNNEDKQVKKNILKKHTLEGVITLNPETFYGVGVNPCIAIFTAHNPHQEEKRSKFVNFKDDGFIISKHIGIVKTERAKEKKEHLLKCWQDKKDAETKFMVKTQIEADDEWLHSFYYFNDELPNPGDFEKIMADYLTFEFNMVMQGKAYLKLLPKCKEYQENMLKTLNEDFLIKNDLDSRKWKEFEVKNVFSDIQRGKRLTKANQIPGKTPYISSSATNNGVDNYISNTENVRIFSNCLTLANSGSIGTCFYQPFEFVASDHVTKLTNDNFNKYIYLFIGSILNRLSEKYSFNREINNIRLKKEKIILPVDDNDIPDWNFMESYMKQFEYKKIQKYLDSIENRIN